MAKPIMNPIFDGFSRSIGNLTFVQRDGTTFVRRKGDGPAHFSQAQNLVHRNFKQASADWTSLPAIIRSAWNNAATHHRGYNHFIGCNSPRYKDRTPIKLSEPIGTPISLACESVTGTSGTFTVNYTLVGNTISADINVFYRKRPVENETYNAFVINSKSITESGSMSITGCIPDSEYEVHVILSDKQLTLAGSVSMSIDMVVKSGA